MKRKAPTGGRAKPPQIEAAPASSAPKNKKRKLKDDTPEIPSFSICWAQLYRYPHWPAKIIDEADIPQEILENKPEKKSKDALLCVEFYGNHDYGWVSSSKIQEFMLDHEGPPGHMKTDTLSPQLLVAMEEARQDLLGHLQSDNESGIPPQPLTSNGIVKLPNFVPFPNLGNTCYVNSALQCLHRVPLFCAAVAESSVGEDSKMIELAYSTLGNLHEADDEDDEDDDPHNSRFSGKTTKDDKDSDTTTSSVNGDGDASAMPKTELVHALRLVMKVLNDPVHSIPGYEAPSLFNTSAAAASSAWAQLTSLDPVGFGLVPQPTSVASTSTTTTKIVDPDTDNGKKDWRGAAHLQHPTLINHKHSDNHKIIVTHRDEEDEEVDIMDDSPAVSAPVEHVGNAAAAAAPLSSHVAQQTSAAGPHKRGERLSPTGKRSTRNSRNRMDADSSSNADAVPDPPLSPKTDSVLAGSISLELDPKSVASAPSTSALLPPPDIVALPKQGRGRPSKAKKEALAAAMVAAAALSHQSNRSQLEKHTGPAAIIPPPKPRIIRDEVERLRADHKPDKDRNSSMNRELSRIMRHFKQASGALLDEKYYTDQHQDISEFIMLLLEYTHQHLKRPLRSNTASTHPLYVSGCAEWNKYFTANFSPVVSSFDGLLRRTRTCPRGHEFQSHEVFRILTLHFNDSDSSSEVSLEDMLRHFKQPEVLECRCSKCGGSDNKHFRQVTDVFVCPKYMIITLGRFKSSMKHSRRGRFEESRWWAHKIKTTVKFPLNGLNLSEIFDISSGQQSPVYNLVAISNHKGSLNGGHYFSYVRQARDGQQWFSLNDQTIRTVRNSALVSNQAYMLFYERVS